MAKAGPREMSHQEILEEAIRARDRFLEEQPHLRPYQDEIDRILGKTAGFENRMSVLALMIEAKLYELKDSIEDLRTAIIKMKETFDPVKIKNAYQALEYAAQVHGYLN